MYHDLPVKFMIRMGLAGILVAIIVNLFQISMIGWVWMIISVFMVMDVRHGLTWPAGLSRILCALFGTMLGYILASMLPSSGFLFWFMGLFIIGYLNALCFFNNPALRMLGMQAAVVFVMAHMPSIDLPIWKIAAQRSLDTSIAIFIVVITSLFGLGDYSISPLRRECHHLFKLFESSAHSLRALFAGPQFDLQSLLAISNKIKKPLQKTAGLLAEAYQENEPQDLKTYTILLRELQETYIVLQTLMKLLKSPQGRPLFEKFSADFENIFRVLADYYQLKMQHSPEYGPEGVLKQALSEAISNLEDHFAHFRQQVNFTEFSLEQLMPMYSMPVYLRQWQKLIGA